MATEKSQFTNKLTLNVQHDYITLKTPNGTFTVGRSGSKAGGKFATHPTAFTKLDKAMHSKGAPTLIEAFRSLLDPEVLEVFFPDWDTPIPNIIVGCFVKLDAAFAKKYPSAYEVCKVDKKYAYVVVNGNKIGFDKSMMVMVDK